MDFLVFFEELDEEGLEAAFEGLVVADFLAFFAVLGALASFFLRGSRAAAAEAAVRVAVSAAALAALRARLLSFSSSASVWPTWPTTSRATRSAVSRAIRSTSAAVRCWLGAGVAAGVAVFLAAGVRVAGVFVAVVFEAVVFEAAAFDAVDFAGAFRAVAGRFDAALVAGLFLAVLFLAVLFVAVLCVAVLFVAGVARGVAFLAGVEAEPVALVEGALPVGPSELAEALRGVGVRDVEVVGVTGVDGSVLLTGASRVPGGGRG